MSMTNNKNVLKWVEEMQALTKPDKVVWIDGSDEQINALKEEAISTGEMIRLNQEELPGCIYHRTKPNVLKTEPLSAPAKRRMLVLPTTGAIPRRCMLS